MFVEETQCGVAKTVSRSPMCKIELKKSLLNGSYQAFCFKMTTPWSLGGVLYVKEHSLFHRVIWHDTFIKT
ncbi:hypothetical protein V1477_016569 [Vespula maculifrons]|uniref:Uncharacterized protein n=1 Tax=Vespula maculifrons TaxID=7453 RepID=A0ABD2B8M9_VESMC